MTDLEQKYKNKYLKYKKKYSILKKQSGGTHLNIFDTGDTDLKIAGYIFTIEPDNTHYIGCVRKVYAGGKGFGTGGAAGTLQKYWGKWGNVGGTRSRESINHLDAMIRELNDETNSAFTTRQVDLTRLNPSWRTPRDIKLTCHLAEKTTHAAVFLFEMKNNVEFFRIFPKLGGNNKNIFNTSHRELDATQALTMKQIVKKQTDEKTKGGNNYFLSYFLETLNEQIIPKLCKMNEPFNKKWSGTKIVYDADVVARMPTEFLHLPWI